MTCTKDELWAAIDTTGMPLLQHKECFVISKFLDEAARWFFVRQEPESNATRLVREALLELDSTGMLTFK